LASDSDSGTVQVGARGVDVEIVSGDTSLPPTGTGTWQVRVTNTGSTPDTYDLSAFGYVAPFAQITPPSVTLDPGASQTAQMTASGMDLALPGNVIVGAVAQSTAESYVRDEDTETLTITAYKAVEVTLLPPVQAVSGTLSATFTLVVTNTGNVNTDVTFSGSANPTASVGLEIAALSVPAHSAVLQQVTVQSSAGGTYLITGQASGGTAQGSDTATLIVEYEGTPPTADIYLPFVARGP
jgi:hypothetical protein